MLFLVAAGCTSYPVEIPVGPVPVPPLPAQEELASDDVPSLATVDPQFEGVHPLDFYVQMALARNPEIRASERRVEALAAVIPQATALPDPMLSNTWWPISYNSPQTAAGRQANSLMLTQKVPWCGKLQYRGAVAAAEVRIALTEVAETQLKIIEAVKAAYYEIHFTQQATAITEENKKFLRDYIRAAETRYKVGRASQQDILRAEVELRKLEDQLVQFRQQQQVAQADLAKLLAIAPATPLQTSGEQLHLDVPEHLDHLYQLALALRPELQGRLQAIFRDEQRVELARLDSYPDVTVGLNWSIITKDNALAGAANGNDNIGLVLGINLPIWKDKLAAEVAEARNWVAESARLYEVARDDTFRVIRRLVAQALALEEQIQLYRRPGTGILASAQQTLDVSFADYRTGKVDSLTVLDNYRQLLFFQLQVVRLEATLGQVLASLERAVGNWNQEQEKKKK
jgi:cobalt-zinc-cadmium efflux system outer membrane protein